MSLWVQGYSFVVTTGLLPPCKVGANHGSDLVEQPWLARPVILEPLGTPRMVRAFWGGKDQEASVEAVGCSEMGLDPTWPGGPQVASRDARDRRCWYRRDAHARFHNKINTHTFGLLRELLRNLPTSVRSSNLIRRPVSHGKEMAVRLWVWARPHSGVGAQPVSSNCYCR